MASIHNCQRNMDSSQHIRDQNSLNSQIFGDGSALKKTRNTSQKGLRNRFFRGDTKDNKNREKNVGPSIYN